MFVPRVPSGGSDLGVLSLIASTSMWEIAAVSVRNEPGTCAALPGCSGYVVSPRWAVDKTISVASTKPKKKDLESFRLVIDALIRSMRRSFSAAWER